MADRGTLTTPTLCDDQDHVAGRAQCGGPAQGLVRATRGEFGPSYYTPVDLVGLYWHLVDLIWIYLFPLLYLIH